MAPGTTRQDLGELALLRRQELDGFVEGLFGDEGGIDLPEKANAALGVLGEVCAMMAGIRALASDAAKPTEAYEPGETFKHVRELTLITEKEINVAVLDCTRARRQAMKDGAGFPQATFH